jgi:ABC-2 type transport system ATP-binding protein
VNFPVAPEAIAVDHLSKVYREKSALRDISFRIDRGESVAYLGPNGAGKTTTLKILSGLARPTSGVARVLGVDPSRDRRRALEKVGTLLEIPGVPPYLTGADLLGYCARVRGIPGEERPGALRRASEGLVPDEFLRQPFGSLSTGIARRTLLAGALVGDPEILLLDEPTMGLDPAARHDLRRVLRDLVRAGKTILLSTHLLEDVQAVSDRVLFLKDGALVGDEPVDPLGSATPGGARGAVRLRFAAPVPAESFAPVVAPPTRFTCEDPRQILVLFDGGEAEQAEIVARTVRAGLPLVSAAVPEPELARRYLEKVGREEVT